MRYILAYRGVGPEPGEAEEIAPQHDVTVVRKQGRHLLVEGERADIRALEQALEGWSGSPERNVPIPRTSRFRRG